MASLQTTASPTSVRCYLDEAKGAEKNLASSLKSINLIPSETEQSNYDNTSTDASSTCYSTSALSVSSLRKKVRFFPLVRSKDTISRHDMTKEELQNCFLQDSEYEEIWKHDERIMRRAQHYHSLGQPFPESLPACLAGFEEDIELRREGYYLCTRGLEGSCKSEQQEAIECVLGEQYYQIVEGYYDEGAIAEIYSINSAQSRHRAVYMALKDRKDELLQ